MLAVPNSTYKPTRRIYSDRTTAPIKTGKLLDSLRIRPPRRHHLALAFLISEPKLTPVRLLTF